VGKCPREIADFGCARIRDLDRQGEQGNGNREDPIAEGVEAAHLTRGMASFFSRFDACPVTRLDHARSPAEMVSPLL
jgi:hypothetical protein